MVLESHNFLAPYSVDICTAVPAVHNLGLTNGAKACLGFIQIPYHVPIHLSFPHLPPCTYTSREKKSQVKNVKMNSTSPLIWKIRGLGEHARNQTPCASYTQKTE